MILPSKELLSEVLGLKVLDKVKNPLYIHKIVGNELWFWHKTKESNNETFINIYELQHKMKEWAYTKKYTLKTTSGAFYVVNIFYDGLGQPVRFVHGTEPEAIFKACEWILKEKQDD